jgi:transposase
MLLAQLQCELRQLQSQIDEADTLIAKAAGNQEPCRRLMAIPGVGPLVLVSRLAKARRLQNMTPAALEFENSPG